MASIILPSRWQSQPQGAVEIDWNSPLSNGLQFCSPPNDHGPFDLVRRSLGTLNGTRWTRQLRVQEPGFVTNGSSFYTTPLPSALATTEFTLFAFASAQAANTSGPILSIYKGGLTGISVGIGSTFSGVEYPSSIVGNGVFGSNAAQFQLRNTPAKIFLMSTGGNNHNLYSGNTLSANDTTTLTAFNSTFILGVGRYMATNYSVASCSTNANLYLLAAYSKVLGEAERRELTANPWQIFRPQKRVLYFDVGGGGVTGTLSVTLENFTSSINGTTTIVVTIAQTMAAFTSAITGTSEVPGTIAATTEAAVGALEGTVGTDGPTGTITGLVEDSMASMAGSTSIVGTMNVTLEENTSSITGTTTVVGQMAASVAGFVSFIYGTSGLQTATNRLLALIGVGK